MLKSICVKNFRLLDEIYVEGLGDLNLIVGKNNSGKSSFLEALRVLCRRGHPSLLQELVAAREETISRVLGEDGSAENSSLRNLFGGRTFPSVDDKKIEISDPLTSQHVTIEHVLYRTEEQTQRDSDGDVTVMRKRVFLSKEGAISHADVQQALSIDSDAGGALMPIDPAEDSERARRTRLISYDRDLPPVSYLSTRFLHPDRLATLWDQAVLTNAEGDILDALRLIEPGVQGMAFVKADDLDRTMYIPARLREERALRGERIALVKLEDTDRPIPLSSMGDGMLRVMQLLLAMYPAKGGYFLIDEFENGLHHSVQYGLWGVLFSLAKRLNIQVIATTHSSDCISAFAAVAAERNDLAGSLFRLKRLSSSNGSGRVVATAFTEQQLIVAQNSNIDLR